MCPNNFFADRQPKTAAAQSLFGFDLDKFIEYSGLIFIWNTCAIIRNGNMNL